MTALFLSGNNSSGDKVEKSEDFFAAGKKTGTWRGG
jgi:hypothetical protein